MHNNKKYYGIVSIFFLIFLLLLFVWFFKGSAAEKEYKMIYISKIIDESNDFWVSLMAGANIAAEEYGVKLQTVAGKSEDDVEGQNQMIAWAIKQKPDALLISPCSYTKSNDLLRAAKDAGIEVVLVDSVNSEYEQYHAVATDNVRAGEELGSYASNFCNEGEGIGVVGYVEGASTGIDRLEGVKRGLGRKAEEIVDVVYCDSKFEKAYSLTVEMIEKHPDLKLLIGLNEYSAVGAARAVRDLGLQDKIKMVGFDSSEEEIKLMEAGIFKGIVIQKPFNMGYLGVEQAIKILEGKKVDTNLYSGSKLITMENVYTEENQKLLFPFVEERNLNE